MSSPLSGSSEYASERARAQAQVSGDPDAVPEGHTVYELRAREVEFYQLARDSFHRRLLYSRDGAGWTRGQLWPLTEPFGAGQPCVASWWAAR